MGLIADLETRNRNFAGRGGHAGLPPLPSAQALVVTCMDHRVDPAAFCELHLGEAMVVRNAGGRVTNEVLANLAFLAALREARGVGAEPFEVVVVHHTNCGTALLADASFRERIVARTGQPGDALANWAVTDPETTVRADVQRVLTSHQPLGPLTVSGYVYDLGTGLLSAVAQGSVGANG